MHIIQIDSNLNIFDNHSSAGFTATTSATIKDFDGLFKLQNSSNADVNVDVTLTSTSEGICPPSSTITLHSNSGYYLATDATKTTPTKYEFNITNPTNHNSQSVTLTIEGYVGCPQITSTANGAIEGWQSCRHNGTVVVRSEEGNDPLTAYFDTAPAGTTTIPGNRSTPLDVPPGANTLILELQTDSSTSLSIDLIDQASPAMVLSLDGSGKLIATTRAVALASGSTLSLVLVNATNTRTEDGVEITVEPNGSAVGSVSIPAPLAGAPATLGTIVIDDNTAWLNIGRPEDETAARVRISNGDPDQASTGTGLFDDPIVVVKHTGCGEGQGG